MDIFKKTVLILFVSKIKKKDVSKVIIILKIWLNFKYKKMIIIYMNNDYW
jgi:hypothetical protein